MRFRTALAVPALLSLLLSIPAASTASPDGAWTTFSSFKSEFDRYAQAFYDPVGDRVLSLFGTGDGALRDGPYVMNLTGPPVWSMLHAQGEAPSSGDAAYDPVRHRIVVLTGGAVTMDVWALELTGIPAWKKLSPAGPAPAKRTGAVVVYDPAGDRVLMLGGQQTSSLSLDESWSLDLSPALAWTWLETAGIAHPSLNDAASMYDPTGERVMVYTGPALYELVLPGIPTWRQVLSLGVEPPARSGASLVHDVPRQRMLLFGGQTSDWTNETWSYDLAGSGGWTQLSPGGAPPSPRKDHGAVYDPLRQRMIVLGTPHDISAGLIDVTMALALSGAPAWSELVTGGTPPREDRTTWVPVFDAGDRTLTIVDPADSRDLGWQLAVDAPHGWTRLSEAGDTTVTPVATFHDPGRDRLLVFTTVGTWSVSLGADPLVWSAVPHDLGPLAGRTVFGSCLDSARDRWLVFGGQIGAAYMNDLWALDLSTLTWSAVATGGTPPSLRRGAAMIVDTAHDRLALHGGKDSGPQTLGDTYLLTLSGSPTWSPLVNNVLRREKAYLTHDASRDRLILAGGWSGSTLFSTVWALPLAAPAWVQLAPSGTPPALDGGYVHDATGDRLLYVSTASSGEPVLKALNFSAGPPPDLACPAPVTVAAPGVSPAYYFVTNPSPEAIEYDFVLTSARDWPGFPLTGRQTIDGGAAAYLQLGVPVPDTSQGPNTLTFHVWKRGEAALADSCDHSFGLGTAFTPPPVAARLSLEGARPNPVTAALNVAFSLTDGSPARLEAFDVGGRLVAGRDVGEFGPGRHVVRLAEAAVLRPGFYLVRLSQSRRSFTARACVVR